MRVVNAVTKRGTRTKERNTRILMGKRSAVMMTTSIPTLMVRGNTHIIKSTLTKVRNTSILMGSASATANQPNRK